PAGHDRAAREAPARCPAVPPGAGARLSGESAVPSRTGQSHGQDRARGELDLPPCETGPFVTHPIQVEALQKSYGEFLAVKGIDFEVRAGEVFGLLGPNGAGKTTTVEILEGLRTRTSGNVSVLGF